MNPSITLSDADLDDELAAPGGRGVNHAATVVTSAAWGGAAGTALSSSVDGTADYGDYRLAYEHGVGSYTRHPGRSFDEVEDQIAAQWADARGASRLAWTEARLASRDAWDRLSADAGRDRP